MNRLSDEDFEKALEVFGPGTIVFMALEELKDLRRWKTDAERSMQIMAITNETLQKRLGPAGAKMLQDLKEERDGFCVSLIEQEQRLGTAKEIAEAKLAKAEALLNRLFNVAYDSRYSDEGVGARIREAIKEIEGRES